jgi:hypothetical protein
MWIASGRLFSQPEALFGDWKLAQASATLRRFARQPLRANHARHFWHLD